MTIKMFMTRIKATLLQAVLVMSLALGFAAPAQAGPFSDWLNCITRGICGGGGSGGGGGGGGGGSGGGNTPEPVDPTGIVHPVYLVGGAFFPTRSTPSPATRSSSTISPIPPTRCVPTTGPGKATPCRRINPGR